MAVPIEIASVTCHFLRGGYNGVLAKENRARVFTLEELKIDGVRWDLFLL